MSQLWLLIDADDTLWENNIYFEEAFDEFVDLLNHSSLSPTQVREVLDEIELVNIQTHGYGSANFGRNMQQCYQHLAEHHWTERNMHAVKAIADRIIDRPMQVFEGVEETLAYLAGRHTLTLYSKGHPDEQRGKIDRSGLRKHFVSCRIVKEKDVAGYRGLLAEKDAKPETTWMIGNSPKSDINPALEAGMGAVFLPHARTWSLEHEDVPEPAERFHVVDGFADLRRLF